MTQCAACAAELPAEARFCLICGQPVRPATCSGCGEALPPQARFCMSCGTPRSSSAPGDAAGAAQPRQASRKVTSILFGDLVGFTALSEGRDQEDVRELLSRYFDACRQVVTRYGGTVEKFIGDAVMAVWGVPTSHEDDAERAVRAGLELVAAVAEFGEDVGAPDLAMRVGIVTGEVAVTVGATHQGMVAGDAVNTAARVQSVAEPGSVWVDETTRLRTAAAITYADVGSHVMKGKADPVPLWAVRAVVAAVGGARRADGLEAPLVGRDRELRLVKELFHQCEESGRPSLLVVDGEPGVGKSRLRWEFEKYVDGVTSTVRWHSGRCIAYGEGVAYFALAEAVRGRLQALGRPQVPGEERIELLLERGLERYLPDDDERSWLRDRLGALLGIGSVGTFTREDLFAAWTVFFERVGEGHPVTLIIDDAQHADEGLLTFLEHLLTTASFGCFVVLLTRPGLIEARPALATHRQANVIHLPPLTDRDLARLVDGLVAGLPEPIREGIVARANGVPLFAVETVRSLIDRDLVVPRGGQYVPADHAQELDLDAIAAPASLQALIAARLDALTTEQRTLVDRASVVGEAFGLEAIEGLCSDLPDVPRILGELVRLQILGRESSRNSAEYGRYRFVQSAVRQVAYATLSRRDRKALHLAVVAQYTELGADGPDTAAIRAQHFLDAVAAVPSDDDVASLRAAALEELRSAAVRARTLGAPAEAARHLTAALGLTDKPDVRGRLGCELARAEFDASEYDASMAHALEAQELLEGVGDRVGAGLAVALRAFSVATGRGQNEEAQALVEPWWRELRHRADALETLGELSRVLMWARWRLKGDVHEIVEARMRMAELSGRTADMIECYNALSIHYATAGAVSLSGALLESAAELARRHHDYPALAITLTNICAMESCRHLGRTTAAAQEATEVARRTGSPWMRNFAEANHAVAAWNIGDWDLLDTLGRDSDRDIGGLDDAIRAMQALRAHARGEPWQPPPPAAHEGGDDQLKNSWRDFLTAVSALHAGDLQGALAGAARAADTAYGESGLWDDFGHMFALTAGLALAVGDEEVLRRLLAAVADDTAPMPVAVQAHSAHLRGLLAMRDVRDGDVEPAMEQALACYCDWGSEPYAARVKADLGRWLVARGRAPEGALLLDEARTTYERLGARRWLDDLARAAPGATIDRPVTTPRSPRE